MRLLGAAQEGGSTVSECFVTVSRINLNERDSWLREWKRTADANHERAKKALSDGHLLTAKSNWLRAISYYLTAITDPSDRDAEDLLESLRRSAHLYLEHLTPGGEVVEIPWLEGYSLEGYFLPSPSNRGRSAVVVCIGEPGHRKEEFLYKTARYARDRDMSLLAVDLLGPDGGLRFGEVVGRPDLETAVGSILDYLLTRHDVDEERIAILGDGTGSSFVARGIAMDERVAAAVCDGGIWDLLERSFLRRRQPQQNEIFPPGRNRLLAQNFKCPVLITMGENGWLDADRVFDLVNQLRTNQQDVSLKIFNRLETASHQGHVDNPSLANEFIFDWIADRLRTSASATAARLTNPLQS
ncbi:alpha/beta hydrolase family protein [Bradyrhizobium lablabi]|uniref:alpha/beta hydrolase family protein n=1 Tax=Bradyrhizobium lablabi TaxID=722472 RepID=UPI002010DB7D|nr:dienelactone hydrolase [Bradyrhizobium lablabi]